MAKAIADVRSSSTALSLRSVWVLRMTLGWITLLGAVLFLLGTSWDVQWHVDVGRDRTLTAPHLVMLGSIVVSGIATLAAVLIETRWARHSSLVMKNSTRFADFFHSSLGAYIAGFGALDTAVGFPIDTYWHELYGIDVSILAPFHVMIITGMSITALGAAYMLASATNLAIRDAAGKATVRSGYIGVTVGLATMMCNLMLFVFGAFSHTGRIVLVINTFPLMVGGFGALALVAATRAIPWRAAATLVTAVYLFFDLVIFLYVPFATNALVGIEQQSYRPNASHNAIISLVWPISLIVAAIVIDLVSGRARRKQWSSRVINTRMISAVLIGFLAVSLLQPFFLFASRSLVSLGVSLLVGVLGSWLGYWFGAGLGDSLQRVER
jgi:hypothetical protein